MNHAEKHRVLHALFCLSRDTRHISASTLARAAEMTPTQAAATLVELERAGLCDATRARLTLLGLAAAVKLGPAASGGGRRHAAPVAALEPPRHASPPLAARGELREPMQLA